MKLPNIGDLSPAMFFVLCLCIGVGVIAGVLFIFKFVHSLIPKFGILVPLGLLAIIICFLKATKK